MGTDTIENLQTAHPFRVHCMMCTELRRLVDRVSEILLEIEAARPGSPEGRQALCNLNSGINKARLLLQYCRESSKLYLALTGDKIIRRCHNIRTILEHSLRQIKNMVPMTLAVKISQIADDLRGATFILGPSEEEIRKAMRELLHQDAKKTSDALEVCESRTLKIAALKLHIVSPKEMVLERRSIRKLIVDVGQNDAIKKKILMYLLHLLMKYGDLILQEIKDANPESSRGSCFFENEPYFGHRNCDSQADILNRAMPPVEFKCPISLRLMYDPVVIASGLTYERVWIEKWFEEGNDTCPKTKMKLPNLSTTPNVDMKNLISKWCIKFGVTIPDPSVEPECPEFWENSIASFGSSMNDIRLPIDVSSLSLGSLDNYYYPDSLKPNRGNNLGRKSERNSEDLPRFQSDSNPNETDLEFLSDLNELTWESKCKVIEDMRNVVGENGACPTLSITVIDRFAIFLKEACDLQDSEAQKNGSELFLLLLRKNRSNKLNVPEEFLKTLASLLNSESTHKVLSIFEDLSSHCKCGTNFIVSGILTSVVDFLDSKVKDLQESAIKIFYNLSSNSEICSKIVSVGCIPKLVPLLNDKDLSGKCIFILKNLCHTRDATTYLTETNGCLYSIVQLLENGDLVEQENAVLILLSLCSQRVEYCELVMAEGVIPFLCDISVNGSEKAKAAALELLRLLREIQDHEEQQPQVLESSLGNATEKKPSKKSGFLGMFGKRNRGKK